MNRQPVQSSGATADQRKVARDESLVGKPREHEAVRLVGEILARARADAVVAAVYDRRNRGLQVERSAVADRRYRAGYRENRAARRRMAKGVRRAMDTAIFIASPGMTMARARSIPSSASRTTCSVTT